MPSRRTFRRDEAGVSEVVGYLLSFAISFLILVSSLYAFGQVQDTARVFTARAELGDVANRVALGVQEAYRVAANRNQTAASVTSSVLRFERTVEVPAQIQGFSYRVTLDRNFVNATSPERAVTASAPTFNVAVNLPASGCPATYTLCALSGAADGSLGRVLISYVFNSGASPIVSEIQIG